MAIIVRITSADGKKIITKQLPRLPANLKVPAGARVDVKDTGTGERMSLGQYVNQHSDPDGKDEDGRPINDRVTIETVQDWALAEQWLDSLANGSTTTATSDSMGNVAATGGTDPWYSSDDGNKDDELLGYDKNTLTLGAIVGGGLAIGAAAALAAGGGGGGSKDTVAPVAPTGLDLATADDTGTSTTDNITSVKEGLTITGTAEAGAEVELFDGTTSLGTTTASSTGTFSFEVALGEGAHAIRAFATDNADNRSAASTTLNITIDSTAPTAVDALSLVAVDDTGPSATDRYTNKTSGLTITGIGPATTTVQLFEGTLLLGTGTTDANGLFNIDVALANGVHSITAISTDAAGNKAAASPPIVITVDTVAPLPVSLLDLAAADDTGSSSTDNITSKTTGLTITGTAEAGATIQLFDITQQLGTVVAAADGTFSIDVNLAVGQHSITANVFDLAGNSTNGTSALEITVVAPGADVFATALQSGLSFG